MPEYRISDEAVEEAAGFGMSGDVRDKLEKMAKYSAPYTHEKGNRRFTKYVLQVVDDEVVGVYRENDLGSSARRSYPASEAKTVEITCPDCEGDGGMCMTCDSQGKVTVVQHG